MAKKKTVEEKPVQAGFRLEPEEVLAFERYCKRERFPLALSDLVHRVFREFLVENDYMKELPKDQS